MVNYEGFDEYSRYDPIDYPDWNEPLVREYVQDGTRVIYNGTPVGRYSGPVVEAFFLAMDSILSQHPGIPAGIEAVPAGNEGIPAGNEGIPAGNEGIPAGNEGIPAGNEGIPAGNEGIPAGNEGIPALETISTEPPQSESSGHGAQ